MDGDGLAETPDGLTDGLGLNVASDGLTEADNDTEADGVMDDVADATPEKSIATDDIGGNGELAYLLSYPIAHTTCVTPLNEICASFASPLFASRLHIITLDDPV